MGSGIRAPDLPKSADRTLRKVVATLHRAVDWALLEMHVDAIGTHHLNMVLVPAEPAVYGRLTRAGRLWMLTKGGLNDGEDPNRAAQDWAPMGGIRSDSHREVTRWVGQALHDQMAVRLVRGPRPSDEETYDFMLMARDELVRRGLAKARLSMSEIDSAWK